jgi:hypothetical protein
VARRAYDRGIEVLGWLLLAVQGLRFFLRVAQATLFVTDSDAAALEPGSARVDLLLLVLTALVLVPLLVALRHGQGWARGGLLLAALVGLVVVGAQLATTLPGAAVMPTLLTGLAGLLCATLVLRITLRR